MLVSRRKFLGGLAAAGALSAVPFSSQANVKRMSAGKGGSNRVPASCPFRLSVINDEISQDFDHACSVAANDFGLHWIELRGMWNKNITDLDAQQIAEARRILKKYDLRVTDIASPLFKVDWPGAPRKDGLKRDQFNAHDDFAQQDALLDHCIGLTKEFGDGPRALLRLLAARGCEAVPGGDQREAAAGRGAMREEQCDSAARERNGLQHRHGRGSSGDAGCGSA